MGTPAKVVVIGSGVAGSAIAIALCRLGYSVDLLFRAPEEGSSFTNQKWSHSGLLYPSETLARKACREFLRNSPLRQFTYHTRTGAKFLALRQQTLDDRQRMWSTWDVRTWGLNWRMLAQDEYRAIDPLGETRAIGGFAVPDRIVNFPALIEHLRKEVQQCGGVISDAMVKHIRVEDGRVMAVELLGGRPQIDCSICVLAAGAWSNTILQESEIRTPDLILRKCIVLEFEGELVPGLTTCLDVRRDDGTDQDVTLVPFQGRTLAAGTGFTEVIAGDDDQLDKQEVERLNDQLVQCFPALRARPSRIVTCIKTEKRPGGKPNVSPQVYGETFHGVAGLTVAIPGKASFMFDLAERVIGEIVGGESGDTHPGRCH